MSGRLEVSVDVQLCHQSIYMFDFADALLEFVMLPYVYSMKIIGPLLPKQSLPTATILHKYVCRMFCVDFLISVLEGHPEF